MRIGVLAIGVGFFPERVSGDKNFWVDLLPLVAGDGFDVSVVSVNDLSASGNVVPSPESPVGLTNWRRAFHAGDTTGFFASAAGALDYRHKHGPIQEQLELVTTLLVRLPELRRLVREREVRIIHTMDNMGLVMPILKMVFPRLLLSHSAMTYMPRGRSYDRYLSLCFAKLDRIAVYSEAYSRILPGLGIPRERIELIRWGVMPGRNTVSPEEKKRVRAKLGVSDGQKLVLWAGQIQQIAGEDFEDAVSAALRVASARKDVRFVFAFKARSFKEEYRRYESDRITVGKPDIYFPLLLGSADVFLSSVRNLRTTVAPPLTWLEAMSNGVPIITTPALGVEEVVVHGSTGYVANSADQLADTIIRALDNPDHEEISENCRRMIADRFDVRKCAESYRAMWRKGLGE